MPSPAPKNIFLGAGDAMNRPWKWHSFLGAGKGVTRPKKYFFGRAECYSDSILFVATGEILIRLWKKSKRFYKLFL